MKVIDEALFLPMNAAMFLIPTVWGAACSTLKLRSVSGNPEEQASQQSGLPHKAGREEMYNISVKRDLCELRSNLIIFEAVCFALQPVSAFWDCAAAPPPPPFYSQHDNSL